MNQKLLLLLLALCQISILNAELVISEHFDTADEFIHPDNACVAWTADTKVAGAGAGYLTAGDSGYGSYSVTLPKDTPEGVLTFWVYDPIFELKKERTWLGINFTSTLEQDGKQVRKNYTFMDFLGASYGGWMFGTDLLTDLRETSAIRHAGWTRFDIVNPPGDEPQQFIVYIDGRETCRTSEKMDSLQKLSIYVRNCTTPIYFDEISYNTVAASFRPSVVQDVLTQRSTLQAGDKLQIELSLGTQGVRKEVGELVVGLYDGAERLINDVTLEINWSQQQGDTLLVELPEPPRSGNFWLQASYTEDGLPLPDVMRTRIDVQHILPGYESYTQQELRIDTAWDFVPSETMAVPQAPPVDWSDADSLIGLWHSRISGMRTVYKADAAWYHQVLDVPSDWKNRRILLDIHDPQSVAYVFVGQEPVGEISWPGGTLDLTGKAEAGETLDLSIFVASEAVFGKNKVVQELLGDKYRVKAWQERRNERGLGGEVTLRSEPKAARIADTFVQTSVVNNRLRVQFECAGLVPGQTYRIESASSAAGLVDKALPAVEFKATSESETVSAEVTWEDPTLWDVGEPFLYSLNAKLELADGAVLDTITPIRFGFREILTEGHLMTLNGAPLSLFDPRGKGAPATRNFGFVDWMRQWGYNSVYRTNGYGSSLEPAFFDEAGIPRRMNATDGFSENCIAQLAQYDLAENEDFWQAYLGQIEYYVKRFRNSPSIFIWRGPHYSSVTGLEMNPYLQDGIWLRDAESDLDQVKIDAGYRCYNFIRSLDPTRYQDDLTTQNYNDTINYHDYLGFYPMQEAIERNEHWIKYGIKPLFLDEWASPFITDWTNSPWEGGGGHNSPRKVPQIAEWAALTMGDDAFVRDATEDAALKVFEETAVKQLAAADAIEDPQKRAVAQGVRSISKAIGAYTHAMLKNHDNIRDQVWKARTLEQVLNWRADGVAGMCAFLGESALEPDILPESYAPVTGFLAGTAKKRTAKDHIYAPGEVLQRSVLILNNSRQPAQVECQWSLTLAGESVAGKSELVTVPVGGQIMLPVEAKISAGGDRQGALSMTLSMDGEELRTESCAIEVLAPRTFNNSHRVALIDPEGDSAANLEKLGVAFQLLPFSADMSSYDTVIFGRRAFDYELKVLAEGLDLGALTRLGKNVLILEQSETILRERFRLRTEYASPRAVFGRVGDSPLLDGLSNASFAYWRGAATLTDGYQVALDNLSPPKGYRSGAWYPYVGNDGKEKKRFMKWGNTHNVATVVMIKPDTGNFRTLVDCGFSLNYAAALELPNANGNVVFSQLDVSGRTEADPAAERYLANLVTYVSELPAPELQQAFYLGDDAGATLLESLRVDVKRIVAPSEADGSGVLVLGDAERQALAGWKDALVSFVKDGGVVFSLPKDAEDFSAEFLPFIVQTEVKAVNQSVIGTPSNPLLAGLGNADFYWKGDVEVTALEAVDADGLVLDSGILAQIPHGQGAYVLCQISPDMFDVDHRFWLDRSRRFNQRTLVNLLSNSGVEMSAPYFLRAPKALAEPAGSIDLAGAWQCLPGNLEQDKCPTDASGWRDLSLPGGVQQQFSDMVARSGTVWYRRSFNVQDMPAGVTAELLIGQISGSDRTFINGVKIGQSDMNTHVNDVAVAVRQYTIPSDLLKTGTNEISIRVDFDRDNLLGLRGSNGAIYPPMCLNFFKPSSALLSLQSATAEEPRLMNQWRASPASFEEFQQNKILNKPTWEWVGHPYNSFNQEKLFAHRGPFVYYMHFHFAPFPADAKPLLLLNGLPEGSVVKLADKPLALVKQRKTGADEFSIERWYSLPVSDLDTAAGEHNRLEIWAPSLRRSVDPTVTPVSVVVLEDPDVLAERERQRRLQWPYLHEEVETEDPYVARHW